MSQTSINYDLELSKLINQFNIICSEMLSLNTKHPIKWQMRFKALNLQKQNLMDLICETIKHVSPKYKEQLKKEFYDKWSIYLA